MDNKQYEVAVLKTESKPEVIKFGTLSTHMMLGLVYLTGELVDKAKKKMFYDKPFSTDEFISQAEELQGLLDQLKASADNGTLTDPGDIAEYDIPLDTDLGKLSLSNINKRLLHVVLGVSSEASELAVALKDAWEARQPIDRINASEEVGDHFWYLAVAADELGVPLSVLFEQNIAKLQDKKAGRYRKGAFDLKEAVQRDLNAEHGMLAGSLSDSRALQMAEAFTGTTAALPLAVVENDLIATLTPNVFYNRHTHEFIIVEIVELRAYSFDNYEDARAVLARHQDQIAGRVIEKPGSKTLLEEVPFKPAECGAIAGYTRSQMPPAVFKEIDSVGGGHVALDKPAPLERHGRAPVKSNLTDKVKGYASAALDKVDAGVDRAKDFLKK